jgi:hypothetical protein
LVELNHLTVPFSIVCLLSQSNFGAATAAARRVQVPRTAPQARFWGKVRNDRVGKTAPAGRPKSDCEQTTNREMRRKRGCYEPRTLPLREPNAAMV